MTFAFRGSSSSCGRGRTALTCTGKGSERVITVTGKRNRESSACSADEAYAKELLTSSGNAGNASKKRSVIPPLPVASAPPRPLNARRCHHSLALLDCYECAMIELDAITAWREVACL